MISTPRPHTVGAPGYRQELPCAPESAVRARRLIKAALCTWTLSRLAEDGTVVVSELVGNAVRHTRGKPLVVSIVRVGAAQVRIAVSDRSTAEPVERTPHDEDTDGRGLLVVAALADRWGTERRRDGKVVWADLSPGPGRGALS
ncbi:ATP-binding protein [Streptomyces sp. ODS05-4]|uniref:ATP-binding protein n=1 Tax=Streptomyces sp. ODS05-4 TaxID=2944939 RepID=UPI00210A1E60|nr:ATP-binding protein [Streptomyces sp. ODS05-4]